MSVLDRYIVRAILSSVLLVMLVILALGALLVFIDQQEDIGTATTPRSGPSGTRWLNLPQLAYELLPITGSSARSWPGRAGARQRTDGGSRQRRVDRAPGRYALLAALLLIFVELLLGELLAPPLQQAAVSRRPSAAEQRQLRWRRRRLGARRRPDPQRGRAVQPTPVRQHADLRAVAAASAARPGHATHATAGSRAGGC